MWTIPSLKSDPSHPIHIGPSTKRTLVGVVLLPDQSTAALPSESNLLLISANSS
jgi:hypothetical protein